MLTQNSGYLLLNNGINHNINYKDCKYMPKLNKMATIITKNEYLASNGYNCKKHTFLSVAMDDDGSLPQNIENLNENVKM